VRHIYHWPTGSGAGGCNALCGAWAPIGQPLPAIVIDHNLGPVLYDVTDDRDKLSCDGCIARLPRRDGCSGTLVILIDRAPFGKKLPERCPLHRRRLRYTGWSAGGRYYYTCPVAQHEELKKVTDEKATARKATP
jgi:hypothetical protein